MLECAALVKADLDAKGLNSIAKEYEDGNVVINFPYGKNVVKCIFSGELGEYVSLYLQFESVPEDKLVDVVFVCNELNSKFKWVKFYVDSDRDLMLEDDAILTTETAADEVFELLLRMIKISDDVKPEIMKAIYA